MGKNTVEMKNQPLFQTETRYFYWSFLTKWMILMVMIMHNNVTQILCKMVFIDWPCVFMP